MIVQGAQVGVRGIGRVGMQHGGGVARTRFQQAAPGAAAFCVRGGEEKRKSGLSRCAVSIKWHLAQKSATKSHKCANKLSRAHIHLGISISIKVLEI